MSSVKTIKSRLAFYESMIEPVYPESFPTNFSLAPLGWWLPDAEISDGEKEFVLSDRTKETVRPLRTLDVEFLSNAIVEKARSGEIDLVKNYPCGLNCPSCFSEEGVYADKERLMRWQEIMAVIDEGIELGLKSVKFLGPGELLQNPDLFDILDAFSDRNLPISIFTKGAELGDDDLARANFGSRGINSAKQLAEALGAYQNVRVLLGFNSFDASLQDRMVGSYNRTSNYIVSEGRFVVRGVKDYTDKRNRALVNLIQAGFNSPDRGQRLSLIAAPVRLEQIDEIPSMYVWAAHRNIPLVIAPTMESGPKSVKLMKHNQSRDPSHQKLLDLYCAVYSAAIQNGITTLDRISEQGISAYMGTAPCNQVANGLFIRLNGQVQMCPGDSHTVFGNTHESRLIDIWRESPNYMLGGISNNWCQAKKNGMPKWLAGEVLNFLYENFETQTSKAHAGHSVEITDNQI